MATDFTKTPASEQVGVVINRLKQPVTLLYNGQEIRLSERNTTQPLTRGLLGPLPTGTVFVAK